jgi:hypothetical protein
MNEHDRDTPISNMLRALRLGRERRGLPVIGTADAYAEFLEELLGAMSADLGRDDAVLLARRVLMEFVSRQQ